MYNQIQTSFPCYQDFNRSGPAFASAQYQPGLMMPLIHNLQQSIVKQRMALQYCLSQQRSQQASLPMRNLPSLAIQQKLLQMNQFQSLMNTQAHESQSLFAKEKSVTEEISVKIESNVEPSTASSLNQYTLENPIEQSTEGELSDTESYERKNKHQIMRRNGFKSQGESDEEESPNKQSRKSNKFITPKRPPSNAKHLWINYGRKIIEFALNNTENEVHNQIKRLVGKLTSKKDFEKIFTVKATDSEEEKTFKALFGKLALFFIKFKAASAFEDSKYKDKMISQRDFVASWIVQLTGL